MYLPSEQFASIVAHTPLVSIDLIVRNSSDQFLLGMRRNCPAQGYWFVPGGRIRKDETISTAFSRIITEELRTNCLLTQSRFLGVYEHFYGDNFSGTDFSTHYVVLAYELCLDVDYSWPTDQHSEYCWLHSVDLLSHPQVHSNSKAYFRE